MVGGASVQMRTGAMADAESEERQETTGHSIQSVLASCRTESIPLRRGDVSRLRHSPASQRLGRPSICRQNRSDRGHRLANGLNAPLLT